MKRFFFLFSISCLLLLFSCSEKQSGKADSVRIGTQQVKEDPYQPYVEGNKIIMRLENEEMDLFAQRYHWAVAQTATGLRIQVMERGKGPLLKEGDKVSMAYNLFLLDGTPLYCSDSTGLKSFVVDKTEEIPALHEAAKLLQTGGKARLIIPSYLGYGVAGDGDRIKGRVPFAMNIMIVNNINNNLN